MDQSEWTDCHLQRLHIAFCYYKPECGELRELVDIEFEDIERTKMLPYFFSSGAQVTYWRYQGYPGETKKHLLKKVVEECVCMDIKLF